ncbi:MAG: dihydrodipicolinate reductase [Pararhodobacter sp.]
MSSQKRTVSMTVLGATLAAGTLLAQPGAASAFERITAAEEFTGLVTGRELSRFGIRLQVTPSTGAASGEISGRGFGYPVTGDWQWRDGYFCRVMDWGGTEIAHNCQMVLRDGQTLRFVSDQGTGDSADFRLR